LNYRKTGVFNLFRFNSLKLCFGFFCHRFTDLKRFSKICESVAVISLMPLGLCPELAY
jgi:hypothetical protein